MRKLPDLCMLVLRQIFGDILEENDVSNEGSGIKGEGYLNEMLFLNIGKQYGSKDLVVKMMPIMDGNIKHFVSVLYDTEIKFYENVWPALDRFQKSILSKSYLDKIPKCFGSASQNGGKVIVLENLKKSGFNMRDCKRFYDRKLVEFVFKHYGLFHALSLALKDKDPIGYGKLKNSFSHNSWHHFKDSSCIRIFMPESTMLAMVGLEDADDDMKNKIMGFAGRVLEEFADVTLYKGSYDIITHGDCWINNFMFKENEHGQLIDLRFVDFQFAQVGTPVYDLSYFFYTGATKDQLDDLEHYLRVYHESLSCKLRELGCDPDQLYPYEVLKNEWKQYSKFGIMLAFGAWSEKFNESPSDITNEDTFREQFRERKIDTKQFFRYTRDMVHHAYQNGFV